MSGMLIIALGMMALLALSLGTIAAECERYAFAGIFSLLGLWLVIGSVCLFCQLGAEQTTPTTTQECIKEDYEGTN